MLLPAEGPRGSPRVPGPERDVGRGGAGSTRCSDPAPSTRCPLGRAPPPGAEPVKAGPGVRQHLRGAAEAGGVLGAADTAPATEVRRQRGGRGGREPGSLPSSMSHCGTFSPESPPRPRPGAGLPSEHRRGPRSRSKVGCLSHARRPDDCTVLPMKKGNRLFKFR